MKRLPQILAAVLLVAIDLLLVVWLLRRPLLEAPLRSWLQQELTAATGSEVRIEAITGDWLTEIRLLGVQVRGEPGALIRRAEDLDLTVSLQPLRLVQGDLSGLRAARLVAKRVCIDTAGTLPAPAAEAAAEDSGSGPDLSALLPGGAMLRIGELEIGAGESWRRGPCRIFLEPGTRRRHLRLTHAGLAAEAALAGGDLGTMTARLQVTDPAGLAASLGLPLPLRDGRLELRARADWSRQRFLAALHLSGARHRRAVLEQSSLEVQLDRQSLQIRRGEVTLPGIRLQTAGLQLPSPLGGAFDPLLARGDLHVQIEDLQPYSDLLPEPLLAELPIRGELDAWLAGGRVHVDAGRVATAGATAEIQSGSIPLQHLDEFAAQPLELAFAVEIPGSRPLAIPGLGELRTRGSLAGTLAGSLAQPDLQATVELGPTSAAGYRAAGLAAELSLAGGELRLRGLRVSGIGVGAVAPQRAGDSELRGGFALQWPTDDQPLRADGELEGVLAPGLVASLVEGSTLPEGLRPMGYRVTGSLALPPGGPPAVRGRLELQDLRLGDLRPCQVVVQVQTEGERLRLVEAGLRGLAEVDLTGSVGLGAEPDLDLRGRVEARDLAWLSAFTGMPPPQQARAALELRGPLADLTAAGTVRALWPSAAELAPIWDAERLGPPPSGPADLQLAVRHDRTGLHLQGLEFSTRANAAGWVVAGQGTLPLHWSPDGLRALQGGDEPLAVEIRLHGSGPEGLDLPWSHTVQVRVTGQATTADLEASTGPGILRGSCSLAAGWTAWTAGDGAWRSAALDGELTLQDIHLQVLPLGDGSRCEDARIGGRATLSGTLDAPVPQLDLGLTAKSIRLAGMPRLNDLRARIEAGPDRVALRDLQASLGAGPLQASAELVAPDKLWTGLGQARLSARVKGKQVLLVNTTDTKLRGDLDLTVSGSLDGELLARGELGITTGRYARRLHFVPGTDLLRARGGGAGTDEIALSLLDPPLGHRIRLDLGIRAVRDFEVRTHVLDAALIPDLRLRGTMARAFVEGAVTATGGRVRLPGSNLKLESLLLTFPEADPTHPRINASASGRRHGYRIQATLTGALFDPQIALSSSPALAAEDLVVLLTTGTLPEDLNRQGAAGQARLLGSYLAQELAAWYLGGETTEDSESFFERLTIETGHEISDSGLESVLVEFQLSDRLYLQAERDIYEAYNGGIVLRFRFR